ncbi:helix-turn-helix domain-containing protein [Bacillus anthracis]|uniref:helix-turn-helix domain-containing protein n=1 Tax=Bacillus anthracis TaxID=1392 RepID=UPI00099BEFC5|nr:helix-turn-helix transcriptional regulator [Bacillus anthracis]OPD52236.1 transcriptional regulator [Bacillus anthracis]
MSNSYLGQNLKYLRKLQGITQKEFASNLSISHYAYNNWENGLREPDLLSLKKFSIYYGILIDELVNTEIQTFDLQNIANEKLDEIKVLEKSNVTTILQENLKRLRTFKNLSRKDISKELNIPYSTYAGWENGFRDPNIPTLQSIAAYHKVSMNNLLNSEILTTEEDTLKLLSRLSHNLYETYMSIPEDQRPELEKQLIAHIKKFKTQQNKK